MLSLKSKFLNSSNCYSLLKRFCKKSSSDASGGAPNVTIQLENDFKLHNLEEKPKNMVSINKETAIKLYRDMLTIRRFENACANLYKEKVIRGFCHLYVGQEACCVGVRLSMRPQDTIISSYRAHGWTYVMGVSVHEIIAELCQKQTGCSRGKGGSMHTYGPNFFGGNGIVASQTPMGAGLALAHAYRCDGGVCFTCYGDGAANQGQLHEAFNMACLWSLPVVFVCENNKYGMGTSIERSSCSTDYYTRGDYIPGLWVNGNDVLAVYSAVEYAINHACSFGPIIMELETYRYHGHSMSDPGTSYRKREEVQMMREQNDPIMKFKEVCLKNKLIKEDEFKKIDDAVKNEVDNAIKQAREDKEPDIAELASDVYVENLEGNIRNILERDLKHINVGTPLVPEGVVKATPKSKITEVTKEEKAVIKPPPANNLQDTKDKKSAADESRNKNKQPIKETTNSSKSDISDKCENSEEPKKK